MDILEFMSLDPNTIISLVSCLAAVASVFVAWKVYRDQSTPEVIAYVDPVVEGSLLAALIVKNIGNAPAYDIAFSIGGEGIPMASNQKEAASVSFIKKGIPMLAPGSHRSIYLGAFRQLADEGASSGELTVTYRFRKGGLKRKEDVFLIETKSFTATPLETPMDIQKLRDIGNNIKKLTDEVKRLRGELHKQSPR
ncbi:hypothetical protein H6A35_06320 [Collinsella tanakaei]|nr:hypothetical protein [Collinsella tanakaei]